MNVWSAYVRWLLIFEKCFSGLILWGGNGGIIFPSCVTVSRMIILEFLISEGLFSRVNREFGIKISRS